MSKRKTRHQKIIADLRQQIISSTTKKTEESVSPIRDISPRDYSFSSPTKMQKTSLSISSLYKVDTSVLVYDLRKTLFFTMLVITAEFFLFYLLRTHVLVIPLVRF